MNDLARRSTAAPAQHCSTSGVQGATRGNLTRATTPGTALPGATLPGATLLLASGHGSGNRPPN